MLRRLEHGDAQERDFATLNSAVEFMMGMTICPLSDALAMPVQSYVLKFRDEFMEHVRRGQCWFPGAEVAPTHRDLWEDRPSWKA